LTSPKFVHFLRISQFFFFNVFLLTIDIGTDVATAVHFFSTGHVSWGLATFLPIFAPFLAKTLLAIIEISKQYFLRKSFQHIDLKV
jgi:hypothetical protein